MSKSSQSSQATVESAGSILRAERAAQGIPIELVAHNLRMRPQQVVDLEQDDHARLPHTSYVRLLILYYAKYLNIAASRLEPHLPEKSASYSGGYQTVCQTLSSEYTSRKAPEFQTSSLPKKVFPAISTCCIILIAVTVGVGAYLSYRHSKEEQNRLTPPPSEAGVSTESSIAKPPPLAAVRAFDSALLEKVPRMTTVHPPPLKVTKGGDSEKKAELMRSASQMSLVPPTKPEGVILPSDAKTTDLH